MNIIQGYYPRIIGPPSKSGLVEPKCEPALETTLEDEYYSRILSKDIRIIDPPSKSGLVEPK